MWRKLSLALILLILLFPVGMIVSASLGYRFELISYRGHSVVVAIVSIGTVVQLRKHAIKPGKAIGFALSVILPAALISGFLLVLRCQNIFTVLSTIVTVGCCFYLTIVFASPSIFKLLSLALSALMILPLIYLSILIPVFTGLSSNTVVMTAESPNGTYCAHIIDSNHGGLGGATNVEVYPRQGINLLFLSTSKPSNRVYSGDWNTYHDMEIHWKNDNCLVINGVEHNID